MGMKASEIEAYIKDGVSRRRYRDQDLAGDDNHFAAVDRLLRLQGQKPRRPASDGLCRAQGPYGRHLACAATADRRQGLEQVAPLLFARAAERILVAPRDELIAQSGCLAQRQGDAGLAFDNRLDDARRSRSASPARARPRHRHSARPRTAPARPWRSCDRANAARRSEKWHQSSSAAIGQSHCHACRARRHGRPPRSRPRARRGCGQSLPAFRVRPAPASASRRSTSRARCDAAAASGKFRQHISGGHQIGGRLRHRPDRRGLCGPAATDAPPGPRNTAVGLDQRDRVERRPGIAAPPMPRCQAPHPRPAGLPAKNRGLPRSPGAKTARVAA